MERSLKPHFLTILSVTVGLGDFKTADNPIIQWAGCEIPRDKNKEEEKGIPMP